MPTLMLRSTSVASTTDLSDCRVGGDNGSVLCKQKSEMKINSRDSIDHVQTHLYSVTGVVSAGLWQAGDTVVTVAQDLDTETLVVLTPNNVIRPISAIASSVLADMSFIDQMQNCWQAF